MLSYRDIIPLHIYNRGFSYGYGINRHSDLCDKTIVRVERSGDGGYYTVEGTLLAISLYLYLILSMYLYIGNVRLVSESHCTVCLIEYTDTGNKYRYLYHSNIIIIIYTILISLSLSIPSVIDTLL
jgi:hypothetical protein